jgi:hypothetical protein
MLGFGVVATCAGACGTPGTSWYCNGRSGLSFTAERKIPAQVLPQDLDAFGSFKASGAYDLGFEG